jgi:hypothetical protein
MNFTLKVWGVTDNIYKRVRIYLKRNLHASSGINYIDLKYLKIPNEMNREIICITLKIIRTTMKINIIIFNYNKNKNICTANNSNIYNTNNSIFNINTFNYNKNDNIYGLNNYNNNY